VALTRELVRPGGLWSEVRVVEETGSTNADVVALARAGAAEGLVLVADRQDAGRGRMGRSWHAPAGTGLTMSVLLRPSGVEAARFGWLPLLAGVAVVRACASYPRIDAALKWPNDLLVRPAVGEHGGAADEAVAWGKCGGILAEAVDAETVVVGIGVNVSQRASQLPPPSDPLAYPATSLARAGARPGRERLAVIMLRGLDHWYGRWVAASGDPDASGLRAAYLSHCATLGQPVTATLPGRGTLRGTAEAVDPDGRLVVATATGEHRLAAGDVHHLRPGRAAGAMASRAGGPSDPPVQGRVPLAPAH